MANDEGNDKVGADNARDLSAVACPFPIVAVGASAGGLDAYKRLLSSTSRPRCRRAA